MKSYDPEEPTSTLFFVMVAVGSGFPPPCEHVTDTTPFLGSKRDVGALKVMLCGGSRRRIGCNQELPSAIASKAMESGDPWSMYNCHVTSMVLTKDFHLNQCR